MTREEAIGHIKDVICENNTIKPNIVVFEQEKEALYMAIEALGQEPILDKIRAEIVDLADADAYGDYQQGFNFGLMRAFGIIDKYKAESKVKTISKDALINHYVKSDLWNAPYKGDEE